MTIYEHEVHLVVYFKTTRKIKSKAELKRIAWRLEHSCLNDNSDRAIYARRDAFIDTMNEVVEE